MSDDVTRHGGTLHAGILFLDTETTGLPDKRKPKMHVDQPHLVQLAAVLRDHNGREWHSVDVVVNPGIRVPEAAANVHGITTDVAAELGLSEGAVIRMVARLLYQADFVCAHNLDFDQEILQIAAGRASIKLPTRPGRCTMKAAAPVVALPPSPRMLEKGMTGPKPPRLTECAQFFFNDPHEVAHSAMADVRMAIRVHDELVRRGAWQEAA